MYEIIAVALCCMMCPAVAAQTAGHSTYYTPAGDPSGGWAGNCGYGDLSRKLAGLDGLSYGNQFFAGSPLLYRGGAGCGECYRAKCKDDATCSQDSVVVTMTDFCPTQGNERWCQPDAHHMDFSGDSFTKLVTTMSVGHVPIEYERVDCARQGNAVASITGSEYWASLIVMNLNGPGRYDSLDVKDGDGDWRTLPRDWGANFVSKSPLKGPLSIRIRDDESGRTLTLTDCIKPGWTSKQEFLCDSNYDSGFVPVSVEQAPQTKVTDGVPQSAPAASDGAPQPQPSPSTMPQVTNSAPQSAPQSQDPKELKYQCTCELLEDQ